MHWKAGVAVTAAAVALLGSAAPAAAAGWALPPVTLAPAANGTGDPAIAMGPAGDAVAVWTAAAPGGQAVVARRRSADGTWGTPAPLPDSTSQTAASPSVAIDGDGDAVAIWTATDDMVPQRARVAQLDPASGTWSAPHDLPPLHDVQPLARVAVNASEEAVAAWVELDAGSSTYLVRAAVRANGSSAWSAPVTVSDPADFSAESFGTPQVAVDADGDATVAWTAQSTSDFSSHVQEATFGGGTWGAAQDLTSSDDLISPVQLAGDGGSGAVAAWRRDNPYTLQAAVRSGGIWGAAGDLSTDVAPTCTAQLAVAADATGGTTVAWEDSALGLSARARTSGGWAATQSVYTPPADTSAQGVRLAASPAGTTAAWSATDAVSGAAGVAAARTDGSGGWGTPVPLASTSDGTSFSTPALAADHGGDALAAWSQTDPLGSTALFAASFTAPPPPAPAPPVAPSPGPSPPPHTLPLPRLKAPLIATPRGGRLRLARGSRTLALGLRNREPLTLRGSATLVYAYRRGTHGPARTIARQPHVSLRPRAHPTLHLRLSDAALRRLRATKGHAYLVKLTLRVRAPDRRLAQTSATYVLSADFGSASRRASAGGTSPRLTLRPWRPRPPARIAC